jgi:DNA-binding NarL/FixJ family response regulator
MSITLVLVDDHPIVLHGLRQLFESSPDFKVVAACRDGAGALEALRTEPVDVLLLDLRMPDQTGLDVMRTIVAEHLPCKTVLLTAALTDDDAVEAVRLGARGVVLKESAPDTLLECVRHVAAGEQWIDQETMSRAFGRVLQRESAVREASRLLTPREIEIVRMIAQGLRNRAVAERLSISEGTVKIHLHNIYEKLGVDGRLALVLFAQEKGLV